MTVRRFLTTAASATILAATIAVSSACAVTAAPSGRVYVRVGPPSPIVETRVVAPGPGYVWVPGYHTWDGRAYVWRPGVWERAPRANAHWVPARWERDRHGWYVVEGHWR